ncbi:MAG: hypothetical protein ACMXYA_02060, partial [Candidatus Woesearchaeota archaeon]
LFDFVKEKLQTSQAFQDIVPPALAEFSADAKFIKKFIPKALSSGLQFYESQDKEYEYLQVLAKKMSEKYECEVTIQTADSSSPIIPGSPRVFIS